MLNNDNFLSTSRAAKVLGVGPTTIKDWVGKGIIKGWRTAGGHRRISQQSVEAILLQRQMDLQHSTSQTNINLLVVDDDLAMIALYETLIKSWQIAVNLITTTSGFDALIKIGKYTPNFIITDLAMPDMDGFQIIHRLKKLDELNNCKIVVVTALDSQQIAQQGGLPEGVLVMQKPASGEKLESLFRQQAESLGINTAERQAWSSGVINHG
ncbi:MAG: response regulator [Magnetococcales bacterium]|nr:response regulator [Magnetococcales bacterium]